MYKILISQRMLNEMFHNEYKVVLILDWMTDGFYSTYQLVISMSRRSCIWYLSMTNVQWDVPLRIRIGIATLISYMIPGVQPGNDILKILWMLMDMLPTEERPITLCLNKRRLYKVSNSTVQKSTEYYSRGDRQKEELEEELHRQKIHCKQIEHYKKPCRSAETNNAKIAAVIDITTVIVRLLTNIKSVRVTSTNARGTSQSTPKEEFQ